MKLLNWTAAKSEVVIPASLAVCAAALLFDTLIFHAFGLRPVISYPELTLVLWAVQIGGAWVFAARWLVVGERRARIALAGVIALMVALSVFHPYHSGALVPVATPDARPVVGTPADGPAVVEFHGGPLSKGTARAA